ncbi:MAG TPA: NADH-quinone oxidoreductase subunit L, partial [Idiomarina sp.]|nr:NADH-quinone oxidoreductase subunit L [Idiomarina sp.]
MNWIQVDELRVTLLVMVALLSWVVLRYTWRNFALEPSRPRAMGWMIGC